MDIGEVVRRLRGTPGSRGRADDRARQPRPFELPITRAIIHVVSVKAALKPGRIGYVRISTFDENTPAELRAAITRLRQQAGGGLPASSSICATTPADCSTRRSTSPATFSIPARS